MGYSVCCLPQIHWSSSYFASRLQLLDVRQFIQMDVPAMRSQTKKHCKCFQHVRPPTFRAKFHHSSMAMMTCRLSPCERYHPVRRWWNHFIIYKNHPSTVMLKIPCGFKNLPSIPIQLANARCDPPHVGTTEQENIVHDAICTFDDKHHAKCLRYNQQ